MNVKHSLHTTTNQDIEDGEGGTSPNINVELVGGGGGGLLSVGRGGRVLHQSSAPGTPLGPPRHGARGRARSPGSAESGAKYCAIMWRRWSREPLPQLLFQGNFKLNLCNF